MEKEIYIILNKKTCYPIPFGKLRKKMAVKYSEVPHDANGGTVKLDVLRVMGYEIEGYEYAILPKAGSMLPRKMYPLSDLVMLTVCTSGVETNPDDLLEEQSDIIDEYRLFGSIQ